MCGERETDRQRPVLSEDGDSVALGHATRLRARDDSVSLSHSRSLARSLAHFPSLARPLSPSLPSLSFSLSLALALSLCQTVIPSPATPFTCHRDSPAPHRHSSLCDFAPPSINILLCYLHSHASSLSSALRLTAHRRAGPAAPPPAGPFPPQARRMSAPPAPRRRRRHARLRRCRRRRG